ncbi:hypothetical protein V6N13_103188 [Hibiscus sabdariffa]
MEVFNSIVGSIASKVAEYNVDLAARQLGYLFKHKSKFLNEMVQRSVDAANRNGEVIFDWLTAVDEKISEEAATQLQEDEEKAMKMCFSRQIYFVFGSSRYNKYKHTNTTAELQSIKMAMEVKSAFEGLEVVLQ